MADDVPYSDILDDLEEAFKEMSSQERKRLESERDFLKKVRDASGLSQSAASKFSSLFMVDKVERFFQDTTPSSYS